MTPKYWAFFILIQLVQIPLFLVGIPICGILSLLKAWHPQICDRAWSSVKGQTIQVWPRLFWLWSNDEDGVLGAKERTLHPTWSDRMIAFWWTAFRNSVHNYCLVPGIFGLNRPIYLKTWTIGGKEYFFKAGWVSAGWPVISAGSGRGW